MCDDGAGRTPRFVSVETCSAEAGRPVPAGWFVRIVMGTHPAAARCAPSVYLFTYADIRDGGSLTH